MIPNLSNLPGLPSNLSVNPADVAAQPSPSCFFGMLPMAFAPVQMQSMLAQASKLTSALPVAIPTQLQSLVSPAGALGSITGKLSGLNNLTGGLGGLTGGLGGLTGSLGGISGALGKIPGGLNGVPGNLAGIAGKIPGGIPNKAGGLLGGLGKLSDLTGKLPGNLNAIAGKLPQNLANLPNVSSLSGAASKYLGQGVTGSLGKYQLNAGGLEQLGFLKSGSLASLGSNALAINGAANWSGLNGVNSKLDFLKNASIQETAIGKLYEQNYQKLSAQTAFFSKLADSEKAGFLQVAQTSGINGAKALFDSFNGKNVNLSQFAQGSVTAVNQYKAGYQASELGKKLLKG